MAYSRVLYSTYHTIGLVNKSKLFFPGVKSSLQFSHYATVQSPSRICSRKYFQLCEKNILTNCLKSTSSCLLTNTRCIRTSGVLQDKSKLEDSLKEKQKQKSSNFESAAIEADATKPSTSKSIEVKKPSLWSRFIAEVKHYYHGFRLLGLDIRIASRTLWKLLRGKHLLRRERKQFLKAVSDIFRLAPFSVFIIIPFAELALPIALKLFPGMLPSTFETSSTRESRLKKELKVKLEMAKFLQDTVEDIAVHTDQSVKKNDAAKSFVEFFKKMRNADEDPTNEEILKHAKLFQDEVTLDNMDRPYLIALCRLIKVPAYGNNELLRFLIRMKLNRLHADDKLISEEGIDTLTTPELMAACQTRGMRALGLTRSRLKQQLSEWVDLHLNYDVPSSLLLLSRVLYLPDTAPVEERVKAAMSTLPEKAAGEAEVRAAELNLERVDNTARYKAAKLEDKEIVMEKAKAAQEKAAAQEKTSDDQATVERDLKEKQAKDDASIEKPGVESEKLSEGPDLVDTAKVIDNNNKITQDDIDVIDDAITKIKTGDASDADLKTELDELREDVEEYKTDVEALTAEIKYEKHDARLLDITAGKLLQNRIGKMIGKMEVMLENLEESEKPKIEDDVNAIAVSDLVQTMQSLTKLSEEKLLKIFATLDTNKDGHIDVKEAANVIKTLNQENVEVTPHQLEEIVKLLAEQVDDKYKEFDKGDSRSKQKPPQENYKKP